MEGPPVVPLPAFSEPSRQFGSGPAAQQPPLTLHPQQTTPTDAGSLKGSPVGPVLTTPSSTGNERNPTKDELANAGKLVRGILGALVVLGDGLIRRFAKRELRRPTPDHLDDFSDPMGQILARHADLSILGPDLLDITSAAAAVGSYLIDGPLTTPRAVVSEVPPWSDGEEDTIVTVAPTESPTEPVIDPKSVTYL